MGTLSLPDTASWKRALLWGKGWDSAVAEGKKRAKDFSPVQGDEEEWRKCESARVGKNGGVERPTSNIQHPMMNGR